MGSVVISACLPCDTVKQFEEVVTTLLRGYGAEVSVFNHVDGSIAIVASEKVPVKEPEPEVVSTPPPAEVDVPHVDTAVAPADSHEPAYTIPSPTPGIPDLAVNLELDGAGAPPADPVPEPELPPPAPVTGEVVLKDLSNVCAVPFHVDNSVECSELVVQGLTVAADCVIFTYCGSTYKLPIASPSNPALVYNANPHYTPTSIRVIADIVGSHEDGWPIIIKLVEGPECCVVFGRDVDSKMFHDLQNSSPISTEAPTSDSLPA